MSASSARRIFCFILLLAMAACGGGGGGDAPADPGPGFNSSVRTIAPASDGSGDVYVGGDFTSYNGTAASRIVRLNANGTVDAGFAIGTGFDSTVRSIAPAADDSGDVYVGGGFTSYNGSAANGIVRLNANGTVDVGFATGTGFDSIVFSIAPAADGSGDVYAGGNFTSYNGSAANCCIVRLNADGTRDAGFAIGTGFDGAVVSIAPAADGSGDIYVGGDFTIYRGAVVNGIVRINADGARDTGFDVGTGFNELVWSIAPAADGSGDVYAGGIFTIYRGAVVNSIVRINADGARDTGFDVGTGFDSSVLSIAPAADGSGDVYAGGGFEIYRGAVVNRLVRINADGARDTGFDVGTGFNNGVFSIAPAAGGSGDVYAGGSFTSYRGAVVNRIARINADGGRDTGF